MVSSGVKPAKTIVAEQSAIRAARTWLLICGALPAGYVVIGRLALLLAITPGYATPVFLPAGIAVAAAFIAGGVTLPAVFLGSFLLNLWIGYSTGYEFDSLKITTAALIALASALQAGIGSAVLRRFIGYPAPLDKPRDLVLLLLLSPILCLTSATVSVGGMWALGVLRSADVVVNWMNWWVGDTLGVLVALPMMLVVFGEPRPLWRFRLWYVAVPMALCLALFVAIFMRARDWEKEQSLTEFRVRSQQTADSVKAALEAQTLFLEQLASAFVNRRIAVDRRDFHGLVQALLHRFPTIQAAEWAPRIVASERARFEAEQRMTFPDFEIRDRDPSQTTRRAADRAEYYPVTYIEPLSGNETAAGFDIASDPSRRAAVDAAIGSGSVVASAPVQLVQDRNREPGVLLINAVSAGPNGAGILLVVLRTHPFVTSLLTPFGAALDLRLTDEGSPRPLFDTLAAAKPVYQAAFPFGTRRYLLQTAPSAAYLAQHRGWQSWTVLAGGVLSTGLLGAFLMLGTGHAYRMRAKESELEAIINRTPFMLTRCDRTLRYRFVSQSYADMIGRRPNDVAGKRLMELMGKKGLKTILPYIKQVLGGQRVEYENEVNIPGIGPRSLHVVYTPEENDHGKIVGWIASMLDITERKRAESQRDLLIAEVNHRVKNTLATVLSIARQSFKNNQSFDAAFHSFDERIQALAQTHDRLAETNWSGVSLRSIVDDETAPYRNADNVDVAGPHLILTPKSALSIGMGIHELATNAAKYGALSRKGGLVEIKWEIAPPAGEVRLTWIESGGPTVSPPLRRGFGRVLLERALAADLNGTVKLDFQEQGLICTIIFPLDPRITNSDGGVVWQGPSAPRQAPVHASP